MLQLRPSCENCGKALPPESTEAMICSFECTFCADCVDHVLHNVCPNCGGGFTPRPVRPKTNWKGDNYLGVYPPTQRVTHHPVDSAEHEVFAASIRRIPPEDR
jgi:uncharacterized protein